MIGPVGPIFVADVECTGSEPDFFNCTSNWEKSCEIRSSRAGVKCTTPSDFGEYDDLCGRNGMIARGNDS